MITSEWLNCYPSNWKGVIVPEAMSHPAKYSSKLIRRIYEHMIEQGWVSAGDRVLDPFGGVSLGAWDAMRLGLDWTGIELEEKFWKLGNENISKFDTQYGSMPHWGSAHLLHGDSRYLLSVIGESVRVSVSSPPYADLMNNSSNEIQNTGAGGDIHLLNYGTTDGQLSAMPARQFDAAISSPPYSDTQAGFQGNNQRRFHDPNYKPEKRDGDEYGSTPGQLGGMKNTGFDAAVSSPPFEKSMLTTDEKFMAQVEKDKRNGSRLQPGIGEYGQTDGQLGNDSGADFWLAARAIVEQVYAALTPGGHAVWVVKDYVKNKQIVPFSAQWRQLCEAVGFVTLHEHHAMLVHHKGTQHLLEGGSVEKVTESKSFFRRLAEKKGSPRIDYETVFCMIKN